MGFFSRIFGDSSSPPEWAAFLEPAKLRGEDPGDYLLRAVLVAIDNSDAITLLGSHD